MLNTFINITISITSKPWVNWCWLIQQQHQFSDHFKNVCAGKGRSYYQEQVIWAGFVYNTNNLHNPKNKNENILLIFFSNKMKLGLVILFLRWFMTSSEEMYWKGVFIQCLINNVHGNSEFLIYKDEHVKVLFLPSNVI